MKTATGWSPMLLIAATLTACSAGAHPRETAAPSLSPTLRAVAVRVARREIISERATVTSVTAETRTGTVRQSNTGQHCTSGRLLEIRLIGSFPHDATTGHPVMSPGTGPPPDFAVRALDLTVDPRSGDTCSITAETAEHAAPRPLPNRLEIG